LVIGCVAAMSKMYLDQMSTHERASFTGFKSGSPAPGSQQKPDHERLPSISGAKSASPTRLSRSGTPELSRSPMPNRRPVMTPADGQIRDGNYYKRVTSEETMCGIPPPSRGTHRMKPAVISPYSPLLDERRSEPHVAVVPLHVVDPNKTFSFGYKGANPFLTTYKKTFAPELRNADYDYESHEGERKQSRPFTARKIAKALFQTIGDKIRQKQGGHKALRLCFKNYSSSNDLPVDCDELRAALRLFNMPLTVAQSRTLFLGLGVDPEEGKITFREFINAVLHAEAAW